MINVIINAVYTLADDFMSVGYARFDGLLRATGFDPGSRAVLEYDSERKEIIRKKGPHTIMIGGSTASYKGPIGNRDDLPFKEMIRLLRKTKGLNNPLPSAQSSFQYHKQPSTQDSRYP